MSCHVTTLNDGPGPSCKVSSRFCSEMMRDYTIDGSHSHCKCCTVLTHGTTTAGSLFVLSRWRGYESEKIIENSKWRSQSYDRFLKHWKFFLAFFFPGIFFRENFVSVNFLREFFHFRRSFFPQIFFADFFLGIFFKGLFWGIFLPDIFFWGNSVTVTPSWFFSRGPFSPFSEKYFFRRHFFSGYLFPGNLFAGTFLRGSSFEEFLEEFFKTSRSRYRRKSDIFIESGEKDEFHSRVVNLCYSI